MNESMIYTMGTALNHACNVGALVQCLVQGQWLAGSVMAVDGHGLVLGRDSEHVVVRLDEVSALRVQGAANLERAWSQESGTVPFQRAG